MWEAVVSVGMVVCGLVIACVLIHSLLKEAKIW